MTRPLPEWSDAVAAMVRAKTGAEPVLALFAEQRFGTIILALAPSPVYPDRLILTVVDTDDDTASVTLDRATVQVLADALAEWLAR